MEWTTDVLCCPLKSGQSHTLTPIRKRRSIVRFSRRCLSYNSPTDDDSKALDQGRVEGVHRYSCGIRWLQKVIEKVRVISRHRDGMHYRVVLHCDQTRTDCLWFHCCLLNPLCRLHSHLFRYRRCCLLLQNKRNTGLIR